MVNLKISVIMSVYNGERYLKEAIDSVLDQTFQDFEFVIINDGSTDRTSEILKGYRDSRLIVVEQKKMGLAKSLNRGIGMTRGKYIARADGDDVSAPSRFERQVALMESHQEIAVVACWYSIIDEEGMEIARRTIPGGGTELDEAMRGSNQICHGSVMMRRDCLEAVGRYRQLFRYAQDYDLWLRMLDQGFQFQVIPEFLYQFRISRKTVGKDGIRVCYKRLARRRLAEPGLGSATDTIKLRTPRENQFLTDGKREALYYYVTGVLELEEDAIKGARGRFLKGLRRAPFRLRMWYRLILTFLPSNVRIAVEKVTVEILRLCTVFWKLGVIE